MKSTEKERGCLSYKNYGKIEDRIYRGLSGAAARTGILRNNTVNEYKKQNNKVWKRKFQKKTDETKSKDNF